MSLANAAGYEFFKHPYFVLAALGAGLPIDSLVDSISVVLRTTVAFRSAKVAKVISYAPRK